MRGDLGLILGLMSGIATAVTYTAWAVRQILKTQRAISQLVRDHERMLAVAHRHDRITGQAVRLKPDRGGTHDRRRL